MVKAVYRLRQVSVDVVVGLNKDGPDDHAVAGADGIV